jgi:UDP-N-acetylglucosamine--N-acetylmuramyl-(pentapeptide) pyrophosphoryl-undecaprenol N-acetylglucosamine transferase
MNDEVLRKQMAEASKEQGITDASERLYQLVQSLI